MKNIKLSTRVTIVLSSIICIIFALQATWSIRKDDVDRREALMLRAKLVTEIQSVALSGPLWDYDQERALSSLEGILKDPDIMLATVRDESGKIFAEVRNSDTVTVSDVDSSVLSTIREISFSPSQTDRRLVGRITVLMSTMRVKHALRRDIISSGFAAVIIMLVMVGGLTLSIRSFTRPIVDMTEIMRRRVDGDYMGDVEDKYLERQDEIGDIARSLEQDQRNRRDEVRLLETTSAIATELNLDLLLSQIMKASSDLLNAERSTLFLYDKKRDVLWSRVAEGMENETIELRPGEGIAGQVWMSGKPEIVSDPYADPRFDSSIDAKSSFRTREILCLPIPNREGKIIGVTQALNKIEGTFSKRDIQRLTSLTAQVSAAMENAQLFENVLSVRNYNESILRSLTNGVISLDQDRRVRKINSAAERILGHLDAEVEGIEISEIIGPHNHWILDALDQVQLSGKPRQIDDSNLNSLASGNIAVNLSASPLMDLEDRQNGFLTVFEDISQEKRVRNTMSRYMPRSIVDQLLEQAEDNLSGSMQTVTMLFSDIRGFTTTSEKIGARETVTMLNEYLTLMVELIEQYDGILDKYIGDAVMALFGAPFAGDDDVSNAVQAAWAMLDSVECLNDIRLSRGEARIDIGLGLNTGEVVVGNIGSKRRMDYTVIGDAVNLAARLESATKIYSSKLLISEFTYSKLSEPLASGFRQIDLMRVKGKLQPVSIYEGLSKGHPLLGCIEEWDGALKAYRRQDWKTARDGFSALLNFSRDSSSKTSVANTLHGDPVSQIYLDRIDRFTDQPPGPAWNGVFSMENK
jgi:adenylate cyclase